MPISHPPRFAEKLDPCCRDWADTPVIFAPPFRPGAPAIVPGIRKLIAVYCTNRLPVIFTRHLNTRQDAGCLGTWWADIIREGDPLSEIIDDFETSAGTVIRKFQKVLFFIGLHGIWLCFLVFRGPLCFSLSWLGLQRFRFMHR